MEVPVAQGSSPDRAVIEARVREITAAAYEAGGEFLEELEAFQAEFLERFGDSGARRFVLFHRMILSTPSASADLFDSRAMSVARRLEELAVKYMKAPQEGA